MIFIAILYMIFWIGLLNIPAICFGILGYYHIVNPHIAYSLSFAWVVVYILIMRQRVIWYEKNHV